MHYRQENIRKQKKKYMKKIFLLGILGCLFAFQQAFAQTDSIGDTHELKNVVVKPQMASRQNPGWIIQN